jgi:pimeloyl-ACP methyl ester carboxylesterase
MIHGMWGGERCWENYSNFFENKGFNCITPTLRYHDIDPGETPDQRLGTTSLLDYAQDLEGEIRKLDEVPILMGHSMGGLLAQILASRGLARALVLLTPASPRGIIALRFSVLRSFLSIFTKWGFWRRPMRQTFREAAYSMLNLLDAEEQKRTYDNFVYESGRAACEIGFWFMYKKGASNVDKSKVGCPILVVAGTEDRITPASIVRRIADKYRPNSTYHEFSNHAHWVLGEPGWKDIAEYVLGWLEMVLGDIKQSPSVKDTDTFNWR